MSYRKIGPEQAREQLESGDGWIYVDVRTVQEFEAGHPPGAFNVPLALPGPTGAMTMNPEFLAVMQQHFPASARLILGCAAGPRSARACELLAAEGYEDLCNMEGGFLGARGPQGRVVEPGWHACGFPINTEADPERTWEALRQPRG